MTAKADALKVIETREDPSRLSGHAWRVGRKAGMPSHFSEQQPAIRSQKRARDILMALGKIAAPAKEPDMNDPNLAHRPLGPRR